MKMNCSVIFDRFWFISSLTTLFSTAAAADIAAELRETFKHKNAKTLNRNVGAIKNYGRGNKFPFRKC